MRGMRFGVAILASLLLFGCDDDTSSEELQQELGIKPAPSSTVIARFDPSERVLPFPNNLAFRGSEDGTLNIPVDPNDPTAAPFLALNELDGWSTVAHITTSFSGALDPATVNASTVRMFQVTLSGIGGGFTGITGELTFGIDYLASVNSLDDTVLSILPLKPLAASSHYLIAVTNGIRGTGGETAVWDRPYVLFKGSSPLIDEDAESFRQSVNAQEAALAGEGLDKGSIVLSWTFSTQSIGVVLDKVREMATGGNPQVNPSSIGTTQTINPQLGGAADVYVGTLDLPYYLKNTDSSETDPLTEFWTGVDPDGLGPGGVSTATPVATSTETVPLLLSVPNTDSGQTKPSPGWKVVIYQHGITSNRTTLLAIADALAAAGFAAVAIDLPLHGLAPDADLYTGNERTFDLDLVTQDSAGTVTARVPGGGTDTSGINFINLTSLLTTRDNLRQGVADLFVVKSSLATLDFDGGGADFDTDEIYFVGHSLGAMVGAVFLALEPDVKAAILGMPGGGIAKLLDRSATLGPVIADGLAAAGGPSKGTPEYERFLFAAQAAVDAGDPINYASAVRTGPTPGTTDRGVLLFEVVGDATTGALPDQTIPNNFGTLAKGFKDVPAGTVPGPLAGTDPLAINMSLSRVTADSQPPPLMGTNLAAWVRFTSGGHSSLLDPGPDAAVTTEMQQELATFLSTNGGTVSISDSTVVE